MPSSFEARLGGLAPPLAMRHNGQRAWYESVDKTLPIYSPLRRYELDVIVNVVNSERDEETDAEIEVSHYELLVETKTLKRKPERGDLFTIDDGRKFKVIADAIDRPVSLTGSTQVFTGINCVLVSA